LSEFFKSVLIGHRFFVVKGNNVTFSPLGLKIFGLFKWKDQCFFPIEISFQVRSESLSKVELFFAKISPHLKLPKNAVQQAAHIHVLLCLQWLLEKIFSLKKFIFLNVIVSYFLLFLLLVFLIPLFKFSARDFANSIGPKPFIF